MLEDRVDQYRQAAAVGADDVEGDLAGRTVHLQHRGVVRLVIDPTARREQVDEAASVRPGRPARNR